MATEAKCIKCNGAMIEGFVFDQNKLEMQQVWVEGKPAYSLWAGMKTSNREKYHVQAFRCSDCNYLEFYTTDKVYL